MKKLNYFIVVMVMSMYATLAHAWQPNGPVTVIVPAPAGSLHDRALKTILPELESQTGQSFVVDYKPGASGVKGTNSFLERPADGQTLLLGASLSLTLSGISSPSIAKWDVVKDFNHVGGLSQATIAITSSKVSTLPELVSIIKSNKPLTVGITFPNQEALIRLMAKNVGSDASNIKFVRYTNPTEALTDTVGNTIDIFVGAIPPTVPLYKAGKLKYLAVSSLKRLDALPDVQALSEVFPKFFMSSDLGISIRSGSPTGAAEYWETQVTKAVKTASAKTLRDRGFFTLDTDIIGTKGYSEILNTTRSMWAETYSQMFSKK